MTALSWGPDCAACGHAQLTHRGPRHDRSCSALECALNVADGWAYASRCAAYVGPTADVPLPDEDAPYERARERSDGFGGEE